jgi:hypothetical protein
MLSEWCKRLSFLVMLLSLTEWRRDATAVIADIHNCCIDMFLCLAFKGEGKGLLVRNWQNFPCIIKYHGMNTYPLLN